MLDTQNLLNQRVAKDWPEQGYDWGTAMLTEGAELMQHMGWQWWKKGQRIDLNQARMEAVDIWHFLLSQIMEDMSESQIHDIFSTYSKRFTDTVDVVEALDVDVYHVLGCAKRFMRSVTERHVGEEDEMINSYLDLIKSLGIDYDELYRLYLGKTQLNMLRWANGYGKSYVKDWDGEEDNEYLTKLLSTLDVSSETYAEEIGAGLAARYAEIQAIEKAKIDLYVKENYDAVAEKL